MHINPAPSEPMQCKAMWLLFLSLFFHRRHRALLVVQTIRWGPDTFKEEHSQRCRRQASWIFHLTIPPDHRQFVCQGKITSKKLRQATNIKCHIKTCELLQVPVETRVSPLYYSLPWFNICQGAEAGKWFHNSAPPSHYCSDTLH